MAYGWTRIIKQKREDRDLLRYRIGEREGLIPLLHLEMEAREHKLRLSKIKEQRELMDRSQGSKESS